MGMTNDMVWVGLVGLVGLVGWLGMFWGSLLAGPGAWSLASLYGTL